jgi:hypothetical protein
MKQARIIHLATHGLLDDFKGLGIPGAIALRKCWRHIALTPSDGDNGLLIADEILEIKFNAELVASVPAILLGAKSSATV